METIHFLKRGIKKKVVYAYFTFPNKTKTNFSFIVISLFELNNERENGYKET